MGRTFLCVMLSMAFAAFAAGNLRDGQDPGFEKGTECWRPMVAGDPHAVFSKDAGINGTGAIVISSPDGECDSGFYAKGFVPVVGGRKYTVEARFKGYIKSGYANIYARLWTGTKGIGQPPGASFFMAVEGPGITECVPDAWSSVHLTLRVPDNCTGIHLQLSAKDFQGVIAFDDVAVYDMDETISIPQLSKAPVIDGKLDDVFVKEATHFTDFMQFPVVNGALAKEQTEVYVGMTTEHIYVAYLLHHNADRKFEGAERFRDDTQIFSDDSIEFFITPMANLNSICHVTINTFGSIHDSRDGNVNWNANIEAATGKLSDTCELIEFRLPLQEIGYKHAVDAGIVQLDFKMSFCRNNNAPGTTRYSTWSRVSSRFEEPDFFRVFKGLGTDFARNCSDRYWKREQARVLTRKADDISWQIENPLYEELITAEPHPEHGESAYMWPRPLEDAGNTKFGLQYGVEYSRDAILKEYEEHRLHPFYHISGIAEVAEWERKTGIGHCLYFPYYLDDWSASYNPATYKKMFDMTRKALEDYPDTIWGISLGDEAYEWFLYHFIDNANNPKKLEASPELREAVRIVKEQYGFGKYGVPKSSRGGSGERFEWLATKNYMYARTQEMQRDLYKLCQEYKYHGKPLVCISGDPMGGHNVVQQQSRDRNYCDVFTGQVVPVASKWRQNICYTTKILKDFTGKSVWPCAHVEPYSRSNDVKATAEYLSEVARAGGSGLQMWNYDLANSNRRMGDTRFDYYGHRPRWDVIMDIADKFRTIGKLKFPKDDLAIYLSTDTFSCYRNPPCDSSEALFTFAGPSSGAWFKFICGTQIRDNDIKLNDWKAIMFSNADVEFVGNQKAFMEYVKNGGVLVCFDADAFTYNEDGTDTSANREALFGAKTVKKDVFAGFSFVEESLSAGIDKATVYSVASKNVLQPLEGTKVLAKFATGDIAATVKDYPGGGRAVLFAAMPNSSHVSSKSWREMMKQLIANLGIKTDEDIWRFQFPYEPEKKPEFRDNCLTSNYFYWYLNQPVEIANVKYNGGTYSYTLPPDGDSADVKYAFPEGNLCNRIKALEIGDYYHPKNAPLMKEGKISTRMFFDTWTKTDAFEISVDLSREAEIHTVKLFFNGSLPSVAAYLDDGTSATAEGQETSGVSMLEIKLNGKSRNVRLAVAARPEGKKLILSEMEIWGK
ncbi:MAG: hypothetical protein J5833_07005 [Victivallales bacterium]|nr:hypothetical protein [Victivallales bacterium]